MGRTREQGSKYLVHIIRQPRFAWVEFSNGSSNPRLFISMSSYNRIVAGFEKRGYKVIS